MAPILKTYGFSAPDDGTNGIQRYEVFLTTPPAQPPQKSNFSRDFRRFSQGPLITTLVGLCILFLGLGVLGLKYEAEIVILTQKVADLFGFAGLCALVFMGDSIPSPLPPDLVLLVISKSAMREHWFFYVSILAICSTFAGQFAYVMGRILIQVEGLPASLKSWPQRHSEAVEKFGPWAVILGATTPLPFSFTCMSAGFLKMEYRRFFMASCIRIPRIFFYYFIISSSNILSVIFG